MTTAIQHLPALNTFYAISEEKKHDFQDKGHVLCPGVVSPEEIATYQDVLVEAVNRLNLEEQDMRKFLGGQPQRQRVVPHLWQRDEICRRFILAHRFGQVAADLLGVDKVRILRDKSCFKVPGEGKPGWHQDALYMPLDAQKMITMWIALSDITETMSPPVFVSKSHNTDYPGMLPPGKEDYDAFEEQLQHKGYSMNGYNSIKAGDALFYTGRMLYNTGGNMDTQTREALMVIYYADGARVQFHDLSQIPFPQNFYVAMTRKDNLARYLPGLGEGDLAVTDINPVTFER